jgi:hypothetical protein
VLFRSNPHAEIDAHTANLIPNHSLPEYGPEYGPFTKIVAGDGTIIVISSRIGALIMVHPEVKNGKVEWSCQASSIHGRIAIPGRCREK